MCDETTNCTQGDSCITLLYTQQGNTTLSKTCGSAGEDPYSYCDDLVLTHPGLDLCSTWFCYTEFCNHSNSSGEITISNMVLSISISASLTLLGGAITK